MHVKIEDLRKKMEHIVGSKYYSTDEAKKIVEVLLYAELAGKNTQGLLKLVGAGAAQHIQPSNKPAVIRETELSAHVDGGGSAGPLAAQVAADKAIAIAGTKGFAIVTLSNTFSSVGAIGYYARKMAQNNLIGIVTANSPRAVLHFGEIDPLYGTNPMAFGFPTATDPITFDMAASAITWYGLVRAKALGKEIPDNVAIGTDGNATTDPSAAMAGAILPFDRSYKGSGMAMVVELMAGVLSGAQYSFEDGDWGTTFIAFSPSLVIDVDEFKKRSSDLVKKIKSGRVREGGQVHVPGFDTEPKIRAALEKGEIEIEEKLWEALEAEDK